MEAPLFKGSWLAIAPAAARLRGLLVFKLPLLHFISLCIYPSVAAACAAATPFSRGVRNVAALGHRSGGLLPSLISQGKTVGVHCFENTLLVLSLGEALGGSALEAPLDKRGYKKIVRQAERLAALDVFGAYCV